MEMLLMVCSWLKGVVLFDPLYYKGARIGLRCITLTMIGILIVDSSVK